VALGCLRLLPKSAVIEADRFTVCGHDVLAATDAEMTRLRGGSVAMVFQDAMGALNPSMRIGRQVAEVVRRHREVASGATVQHRALELLERVGMPDPARIARQYPHQLSGGLRQRAAVALALAGEPSFLVADEPTTALDVTVQAGVLELFREIRDDLGVGILLVSHDIGVIAQTADRVEVMLDGEIVERGSVESVLLSPRTDYTRMLIASAPEMRLGAPADGGATVGTAEPAQPIMEVQGIGKTYRSRGRVVDAVSDVSFQVRRGEVLSIVGESGSGKSTLAKMFVGLEQPSAGSFRHDSSSGRADGRPEGRARGAARRAIQMVFQHPAGSLNPRLTVGRSVAEPLTAAGMRRRDAQAAVGRALEEVGLPADAIDRYPDQFSGGQKQRIAIARAVAADPRIVILDEPTSALDVSVQAQILDLLARVREEKEFTYLFISHDLAVVQLISDRVAVMYSGRIVELADAEVLFERPAHWYTDALLKAVPSPDPRVRSALARPARDAEPVEGDPACAFAPRCPRAESRCWTERPELVPVDDRQQVACHFPMAAPTGVSGSTESEARVL
jgi:peptide/nickel transport system ATP-binding protein